MTNKLPAIRIGMRVKYRYSFRPHRTATAWTEGTAKVVGVNNRSDLPITVTQDDGRTVRIKRCEVVRITRET